MSDSKRLRKQMAKIEFKACRERVEAMLAQDFNHRLIHEKLTEEGLITMAYPSFTQKLRNLQRAPLAGKPPEKPLSPQAAGDGRKPDPGRPFRGPGIIKPGLEPFPDPKNIDPKTLI
jgi:hypothetical protein